MAQDIFDQIHAQQTGAPAVDPAIVAAGAPQAAPRARPALSNPAAPAGDIFDRIHASRPAPAAQPAAVPPKWESWTSDDPAKQNIFRSMYDEALAPTVSMVMDTIKRGDLGERAAREMLSGFADQINNFTVHPEARNVPLVGPGYHALVDRMDRQYKAGNYQGMIGTGLGAIGIFLAPEAAASAIEKLPAAAQAAAIASDATGRFGAAAGAGLKAGVKAAAPDIVAAAKLGAPAIIAQRLAPGGLAGVVEAGADIVSAAQAGRGLYRGAKAAGAAYQDVRAAQTAAAEAAAARAARGPRVAVWQQAYADADAAAAADAARPPTSPMWQDARGGTEPTPAPGEPAAGAAPLAANFESAPDARATLTPEMQARADAERAASHAEGGAPPAVEAPAGAELTVEQTRPLTPQEKLEDAIHQHAAYLRMQADHLEWGNRARQADRYAEWFINNNLEPTPENLQRAAAELEPRAISKRTGLPIGKAEPPSDETVPMIQDRVVWWRAKQTQAAAPEAVPEAPALDSADAVRRALGAGETVPAAVLNDYPELMAKANPAQVSAAEAKAAKVKAAAEALRDELAKSEAGAAAPAAPTYGGLSERLGNAADNAIQRMRDRGSFTGSKLNSMPDPADLADLSIWGAAKLAQGTVDFAKWSKQMVSEFGDQVKPFLESVYAAATKTFERHVQKTEDQLPTTRELLRLTKEGEAGKDWYTNTHGELVDMFGPDAELMEKFLAATSPNNTIAGNVSQALKAYRQYRTGQAFEGYLPVHKTALDAIVRGDSFGGPKVDSFLRNLRGETMPVTVDRWMARAFNFGDSVTPAQYKFLDYWMTQLAKRANMEPSQLQAAIWVAIKEAQQKSAGLTSLPFESLLPKKIAADPQMQALIAKAKAGEVAPARP